MNLPQESTAGSGEQKVRWVGIDEAGYGPNLGPLVMTAVVVEGPAGRTPDVWGDLVDKVARAGTKDPRLWVDDSKQVYQGGKGRDRLESATLALLDSIGTQVNSLEQLLTGVNASQAARDALRFWLESGSLGLPTAESSKACMDAIPSKPFHGAPWRIVAVHSEVVDAAEFNQMLRPTNSKADVHFATFLRLIRPLVRSGIETHVRGDKHGGRHYYYGPLVDAFPDGWIDRVEESAARSRYLIREGPEELTLELTPRADGEDGLVALASIVSKTIRELWMDVFNGYWGRRVPGIKPTAGYPQDARRFAEVVEPVALEMGLKPDFWWRRK